MLDNKFYERLEKIYSKEDIKIIKSSFETKKREVSFRINTLKSNKQEIETFLWENNFKFKKVSFLPDSYILPEIIEKDIWNTSIYKDWKIYLQSISSQIPSTLLELKENDRVLDITAAPWSKTTQISALLKNTWEIVACEQNMIRMEKLKYNIKKLWCTNITTFKWDARKLQNFYKKESFDSILADLPCSWEWRINLNNPKTYSFWNEPNIKRNYLLQKDIIKNTIFLLKPGWVFVYSTCTMSPEENEWIVHYILSNFKDMELDDINLEYKYFRPWIKKFDKYVYQNDIIKTIRSIPSEESEWFFVAKFKKKNYN